MRTCLKIGGGGGREPRKARNVAHWQNVCLTCRRSVSIPSTKVEKGRAYQKQMKMKLNNILIFKY